VVCLWDEEDIIGLWVMVAFRLGGCCRVRNIRGGDVDVDGRPATGVGNGFGWSQGVVGVDRGFLSLISYSLVMLLYSAHIENPFRYLYFSIQAQVGMRFQLYCRAGKVCIK
jgi:hypothetical protein